MVLILGQMCNVCDMLQRSVGLARIGWVIQAHVYCVQMGCTAQKRWTTARLVDTQTTGGPMARARRHRLIANVGHISPLSVILGAKIWLSLLGTGYPHVSEVKVSDPVTDGDIKNHQE